MYLVLYWPFGTISTLLIPKDSIADEHISTLAVLLLTS
jgi:hypothetical protein